MTTAPSTDQQTAPAVTPVPKRLILTAPQGGGTSKTSSAVLLASLASLAGKRVILVDADVTTRGLYSWLGDKRVMRLTAEPADAQRFPDELLAAAADCDLVIIDAGAGAMLMPMVGQVITSAAGTFASAGWQVTLALALVATKPGLADDVARTVSTYSGRAEIFAVLTGAPRSAFAHVEQQLGGAPCIEVGELPRALLELMAARQQDAAEFIQAPAADHSRAAGLLASRLLAVARQDATSRLIDCTAALPLLKSRAALAPARFYMPPKSIEDRWLTADETMILARDALEVADPSDDAALLSAARCYVEAQRARARLA
jgi:hypothetical protein